MGARGHFPAVCFVWQPFDINDAVLEIDKAGEARIVVDLSGSSLTDFQDKGPLFKDIDVKISLQQFVDSSTCDFLNTSGIRTIWLEYFPELLPFDFDSFLDRLRTFKAITLVTGDIEFIRYYFKNSMTNCGLALKGSEASGFVGSETALTLLSLAERLATECSFQPSIHVWGGAATPEAAAAFLASGIQSVVLEGLHWLTQSFKQTYPLATGKISRLRVDHSALIRISPTLFFRAFTKGNNRAFREISRKETGESSMAVHHCATSIASSAVHPLTSDFDGRQIIPIGIDAAFAESFRQRFGEESPAAMVRFSREADRLVARSQDTLEEFFAGGIAPEMGIKYPFLQGGMACITDIPAFALAVAKAGGLPTIAFGMQDPNQIEQRYAGLHKQLEGYPYAINVIALSENPFRDAQLSWIMKNRPPFVVISAGDPAFAVQLQEQDIQTIFVASDVDLLQLAWKRGISYVVCEGCEAGGHVGELSLLTLAQTFLETKRKTAKGQEKGKRLIFAGGIFDPLSLFRAALLGAEAVQMGTAYLATAEIVAMGAVGKLYQRLIVDSSAGETTITGESVGLRIRSLISPKIRRLQQLEEAYAAAGTDGSVIRKNIELESGGSLYKAARGMDPVTGSPLSDEECLDQGQFMSGAIAGMLSRVVPIADFHARMAGRHPGAILQRHAANDPVPVAPSQATRMEGLAITGIAAANALGNSPEVIWQSCIGMKSGIGSIPQSRWDHSRFYSRSGNPSGKTYCKVGAFLSIDISRKELGISPHDFRTMTDSTKLTLWLAHRAIQDSGILSSDLRRDRIGVIISQNSGEMGSTAEDLTLCVNAQTIAQSIQEHLGLDPEMRRELEDVLKAGRISIDDTTLLGRLNCTAGGFICNRYGFTGPSYSVSAACATGLVALYSAIQLIRNGILDAAVIGGGEELLHPASYLEFSALGALAGKTFHTDDPAATSRPFDRDRDGMVLGEGGAVIVVERKSLAIARQKKIYACIAGIGASNNHKGMIESVAETQQLAIDASFRDAQYGPDQVDMVECHATATATGDIEEVTALKAVYPKGNQVVLGSFKSQIGHTLGTSGLTSLIRGILAMQAGIFPPTLNYDTVDTRIDLESWGFRVCRRPERWPRRAERPRRLQVNAFGFGGANYVVQLEEAGWNGEAEDRPAYEQRISAAGVSLESIGVKAYRASLDGKEYRVGSVQPDGGAEQVKKTLRRYVATGGLTEVQQSKLAKEGLFISDAAEDFPLALMFAGQGTHYSRMGLELYETFPTIRKWMGKVAELADFDILHLLFHDEETNLRKTVWQQPALFVLEYAIYRQLRECNLQPVALAGHSMGELTALTVAGCFSYEDAFRIISKRAACMEKAGKIAPDPGSMIAVDVPEDILDGLVASDPNLFYTNFNSAHQIVIGGGTREIEALKQELDDRKYWNHVLAVSMAFHSPLMRIIRDDLGDYLDGIDFKPPRVPVISNTTRQPYPSDPEEIRKIILAHLESPVYWRDNVATIRNEYGARFFVEIGPQDTLCKLLRDIAPETPGMPACYPGQEAVSLRKAVAALVAKGHTVAAEPPCSLDLHEETGPQEGRSQMRDMARISEIIQREINAFALDGVERYLKPAIVRAIQQEVDPSFKSRELGAYFLSKGPENKAFVAAPAAAVPGGGSVDEKPNAPDTALPRDQDIVEQVISIIMDATGYERSELEPDMDIRQDLSIRSSRLPIIMDAAERTFNIVIKLEEFMDVRTIGDFARRVAETIDNQGASPPAQVPDLLKDTPAAGLMRKESSVKTAYPISRRVFRRREVVPAPETADRITAGGHVLLLALGVDDSEVRRVLETEYGLQVTSLTVTWNEERPGTIDLRLAERAQQKVLEIARKNPLSGLVLLSEARDTLLPGDVSVFCTGFFAVLQVLLKSAQRSFCLHLSEEHGNNGVADMLAEGILGIFLSAGLEYQGMLFRSFRNGIEAGVRQGLKQALDAGLQPVDLVYADGRIVTNVLAREPLPYRKQPLLQIGGQDVVLVSGGARGITSFVARALASRGCKMILIGRSKVNSSIDTKNVSDTGGQEAGEIQASLEALRAAGTEVEYRCCDVTDSRQVATLVRDVKTRYGRIDGIVHGAGILKDGFIQLLTPADFHTVLATKVSGIINLVEACDRELRFIVGLSSIAALTGNVGQANYCCANRAMAAYISSLHEQNPAMTVKTFWLPPVAGIGMANDPDLKEIIAIKIGDHAFADVSEVSGIILKELIFGPAEEDSVIPVRQLPAVPSVVMEEAAVTGSDWFDCRPFLLLDRVLSVDLMNETLQVERVFSHARDLWLIDHRPFTWLAHPIVSAIMIVETFLETSRLLFPSLQVRQMEEIRFSRMFECPRDQETGAQIHCRSEQKNGGDRVCHLAFGKTVSPVQLGEQPRLSTYFNGRVVMSKSPEKSGKANPEVRIAPKNSRPVMDKEQVIRYYQERSGLTGRYRVLENIVEYAPRSIAGEMVYPEENDFSPPAGGSYHYPAYALEGLMQLVSFHAGIREKQQQRTVVPAGIASLRVWQRCAAGERLYLIGDLQDEDETGMNWQVRAFGGDGHAVMLVDGLKMNWLD